MAEGLGVAFEQVGEAIREMAPAVELMTRQISILVDGGWVHMPVNDARVSAMRVPVDAPPPTIGEPYNSTAFDIQRCPGYWQRQYGQQSVYPDRRQHSVTIPAPLQETLNVLYGGAQWDDQSWGESYPCQLCWAVRRWPWEPARSCPKNMPVESTYCSKHRS